MTTSAAGAVLWDVAYRYDPLGNVLSRTETDHTDPSGTPQVDAFDAYFHDVGQRAGGLGGLDDLLLTADAAGQTTRRFLHGPGVDDVLAEETVTGGSNGDAPSNGSSSSTVTLWTLTDHLGSVVGWLGYELATGSTTVESWAQYSAFGQALTGPGTAAVGSGLAYTVGTTHGYTGRWTDGRTGLQNNRARWYDAETGKWASEDPIGFDAGDANLSRYVGTGVLGATDPTGLEVRIVGNDAASNQEAEELIDDIGDVCAEGSFFDRMINGPDDIVIQNVPGSRVVLVGSHGSTPGTSLIDMGDIMEFPTSDGPGSRLSMMAHELFEAYDEQIRGRRDIVSHNGASAIEDNFNGGYSRVTSPGRDAERDRSRRLADRFGIRPGPGEGILVLPYTGGDDGPQYLCVSEEDGNVTDVWRRGR